MTNAYRIGFGGGCHWCTEAVFQHVDGVLKVEQGWISSAFPNEAFSEAVIVYFDAISLEKLIEIHLATHSSNSSHSMRKKYRSAIYYFDQESREQATNKLARDYSDSSISQVIPFVDFKLNDETYLDYYKKNPQSPFCRRYIEPKLEKVKALGLESKK